MKKYLLIALLAFTCISNATTLETTTNLNVYYPEYSRIDLVCDRHFTTGGSLLDSLNK